MAVHGVRGGNVTCHGIALRNIGTSPGANGSRQGPAKGFFSHLMKANDQLAGKQSSVCSARLLSGHFHPSWESRMVAGYRFAVARRSQESWATDIEDGILEARTAWGRRHRVQVISAHCRGMVSMFHDSFAENLISFVPNQMVMM